MILVRHFLLLTIAASMLILSGCRSRTPKRIQQPVQQRIGLANAIQTAVKMRLDSRVNDSLQQIAQEHVEKRRLLELPGLIADLPRRLPRLTVDNDYRITTLARAVESSRILMTRSSGDLNTIQAEVEKRKIAMEQAVFWSKLDYLNNLKTAGINYPGLKTTEKDIILELTISAGIPQEMIKNFDYTSLPSPCAITENPVPDYIKMMLKTYNNAPETALRFADIVYRLPSELLRRTDSDYTAAFSLAQAAAAAISGDILRKYRLDALKRFKRAEKLFTQSPSAKIRFEMEQAKLVWRIAYFKILYMEHQFPVNPDKKEIAFLSDLIALQSQII